MSCNIHQTAIVDSKAQLGADVEIGPYSIIGANVRIGDRCKIATHVVVEGHTTLGKECHLFQFSSVGAAPQDLKYKGEPTTLIVGDRNIVRECVTLHPGTVTGTGSTVIGDGNLFMANCHVGHDCRIGNNNVLANSAGLAGHVHIHNNVILGGMVGIHQFCRIGSYVMISAGSMVGLDIPPYCIGQGDRACLRGINLIGLQRSGMNEEEISAIKKTYRHLFSKVGHLKEKIESLPEELAKQPKVKLMMDFLAESKRGVLNPAKSLE
ncbi:MAG: acyl-ACP--UDP-N-acetylglucosamine O-acyltransferase [Proteobacteria bacterium]|nr:acyl-ACP--UDP-N-acetylglucosamine O-acyltransferase [Pseudomonadota bacterium]